MNTKFKIGEKVIYKNEILYVSRIVINRKNIRYQIESDHCVGWVGYANILESELKKYEPILDNTEKRYLENVIRPFKDRVKSITKSSNFGDEYIKIYLKEKDTAVLPNFKKDTMYKGMIREKSYTLKELGLFEEER